MKVLLAGASGAIGRPLMDRLISHGHEVIALARDPASTKVLSVAGATPVIADALDREALLHSVDGMAADAVVHELTALRKPPRTARGMVQTNRLRVEGTANLIRAADVLGATRFVTQSMFLGYGYCDHGNRVLTEDDPFGRTTGTRNPDAVAAMLSTEQQAFGMREGIALRYGLIYGRDPQIPAFLAKRAVPVSDGGVLPWVHLDDVVTATVAALERGRSGQAYNIVDDQPASWRQVVNAMAGAIGAPPPRSVPRWLFRLAAPLFASIAVETSTRVSNAKAAAELDWRPQYPTYREGVRTMTRAQTATRTGG